MNHYIKIAVVGVCAGFSYGFIFGYVPVQVQALKNALQNSTQIINCSNCDFRGVVGLAGLDLHGLYAPGILFQPCIVTAENKDNGFMVCVPNQASDLTGINLANGYTPSSCYDYAKLDKADLTNLDLSNSSVENASLKDAKVAGIKATNATFCNSVMPDGQLCTGDSWTGQGVTIACNCPKVSLSKDSKLIKQDNKKNGSK